MLRGSCALVMDLVRGNWCNGFWLLLCNKFAQATVNFPSANNCQTNTASSGTDDDTISTATRYLVCTSAQHCCSKYGFTIEVTSCMTPNRTGKHFFESVESGVVDIAHALLELIFIMNDSVF